MTAALPYATSVLPLSAKGVGPFSEPAGAHNVAGELGVVQDVEHVDEELAVSFAAARNGS